MLPAAPGVLEGAVSFPIRGQIGFRLLRTPSDETGEEFGNLRCMSFAPDECRVAKRGTTWRGAIRVEGYAYQVRILDKKWRIEFLDAGEITE